MPVDTSMADLSHTLFVVAMFGYLVAMFGFALEPVLLRRTISGDLRADDQLAQAAQPVRETVAVGAATSARPVGASSVPLSVGPTGTRSYVDRPAGIGSGKAVLAGDGGASWARRTAITVMAVAFAIHLASTVARGLAVHRPPFGNMFEFSSALALSATGVFLVLLVRQRISYLGVYLLVPVLLTMGVADTILYVPAEPLQPVLNSYWLWIHVTAAIVSTGVFLVGCTAGALYLVADSYRSRLAQGRPPGLTALARRLPAPAVLDRLSYRTIAAGFPLWTFAVIAGAVWAESAWGRYWGWDPKETWAFITWVIFAGYLHARSTAGWRGRKAAWIAVVGLLAFTFNYFGVNFWVNGLHSYAGV